MTRKLPHSPADKDSLIEQLVGSSASGRRAEIMSELIETVLLMGRDEAAIGDLKLFSRALKEMRYASHVFRKFEGKRKVAVFGSARTKPEAEEFKVARSFAEKMAARGFMIITGGGDGIMGAAQEGAGAEMSFGLNIRLPFEQKPNETIQNDPKLINFNYFFTRKLSFVKETDAFVLCPGGFGTHDEGFEALTLMQTGKTCIVPIVFLDRPNGHYWETYRRFLDNDLLESGLISPSDFHLFRITHDPDEAVQEIVNFYRVFHSYRWVREQMVIRIQKPLTAAAIEDLNIRFEHILAAGKILQTTALPEEADDGHLAAFPRVVLTPHKRDFGMIRLFIDAINRAETV